MKIQHILTATVIFGLFLLVSSNDYDDAVAQQSTYCEMVALWNADAKRGIAPNDRAGWPPFEGEHQCQNP